MMYVGSCWDVKGFERSRRRREERSGNTAIMIISQDFCALPICKSNFFSLHNECAQYVNVKMSYMIMLTLIS